ncbi:MAG: glycogen synthase GlgA [Pseudomonadota bacterium]|nr:glycogen synthase GlgA [Pseudomonadota bacterium]
MALQSLSFEPRIESRRAAVAAPARPSAQLFALPRARPKVLFATSEIADFVQTGGLGAVSASLPRALRASCDVRVILPGYAQVLAKAPPLQVVERLPGLAGLPPCSIAAGATPDGLALLVVLCDELYCRDGGPYADARGVDYADNDVRFARLSLAAAEIAARGAGGWTPDLVHLNDWPTALAAGYLAWRGAATPSLLTIHNLAHLGQFPAGRLGALAIPGEAFGLDGVEFHGQVSFLKAGLAFSRHVSTVSETYAREIVAPERGCGLDGLLALRAGQGRLSGVINGVEEEWDPRADRNCPYQFDPTRWKGRYADFVRGAFGLSLARAPLFAFVARFAHQKGVDLVIEAAEGLVARGGQIVAVGEGEAEAALRDLSRRWPDAAAVRAPFDAGMARAVFAGADFLLMPSRYEPCGLSQMYAQKFGALPIAHRTGGIAETVFDGRTGLLFDAPERLALEGAIARAFALYQNSREFSAMRRAAMALDFSWGRSAARYVELYRGLSGAGALGG